MYRIQVLIRIALHLSVIFLLTFMLNGSSLAQSKGDIYFNLEQCIEIAQRKNLDIQLSNATVEAVSSEITSAFGQFLPNINLNMRYDRQLDNVLFTNFQGQIIQLPAGTFQPNSFSMSATAGYTIFNGFARESNYSRAQDNFNSKYLTAQYDQTGVTIEVFRRYIDIVRKSKIVRIRQENLLLGQAELERIIAQKDAGLVPITFIYSQETELANREYDLVVAVNELDLSKAAMLELMGMEPSLEANFDESNIPENISLEDIAEFRKEIGSMEASFKSALEERLDLKAQNLSIKAAESSVTIASSGYYPSLSAFGGWSWTNYQLSDFGPLGRTFLGLNLSIPIFENFATQAQIQSAELQVKQLNLEKQRREQNIRTAVKVAFLNLEATEKQMDITSRAIKSAEINYESTSERFKVGSANLTDNLTANNQLITSRINRINTVYNYYLAKKELLFAIGQLLK